MAYEVLISDTGRIDLRLVYLRPGKKWQRLYTDAERTEAEAVTVKCTNENAINVFLSSFHLPLRPQDLTQATPDSEIFVVTDDSDLVFETPPNSTGVLEISASNSAAPARQVIFRPYNIPTGKVRTVGAIDLELGELNFN